MAENGVIRLGNAKHVLESALRSLASRSEGHFYLSWNRLRIRAGASLCGYFKKSTQKSLT